MMTYPASQKQIDEIHALLPKIQCGLCNYPGCQPYAEAMVLKKENIDQCLPGGIETLLALASYFNQDPTPLLPKMQEKMRPAMRATIDEETCIGCTKCLPVCPTDAIVGAAKSMHTVIASACTGCGLCLPPCPMDCIQLNPIPEPHTLEKQEHAQRWERRYHHHKSRLKDRDQEEHQAHQRAKLSQTSTHDTLTARKQAIQDSLMRAAQKRKTNP